PGPRPWFNHRCTAGNAGDLRRVTILGECGAPLSRATSDCRACGELRYFGQCPANPRSPESRSQGRRGIRENTKDLIEPRDFKDRADAFLQTGERKFPSVAAYVLHRLDQCGQTRAVDVTDL